MTKAAPQSTPHSQVMTVSSDDQPIGKFRRYRNTIWTMKATNITASRAARTFSARRRSQLPACRGTVLTAAGDYFSALIFSSMPAGQPFAWSEPRYIFWACSRKALTSGA